MRLWDEGLVTTLTGREPYRQVRKVRESTEIWNTDSSTGSLLQQKLRMPGTL